MARDDGDSVYEDHPRRPGVLAASTLLPIVRAAMSRGEGPPAVLRWVKRQGRATAARVKWTPADEARAVALARRLAVTLNDRRRGDAVTEQLHVTVAPE